MPQYKFTFHKIDYDMFECYAEDDQKAAEKAVVFLEALRTDYYQGGEWVMEPEVEIK